MLIIIPGCRVCFLSFLFNNVLLYYLYYCCSSRYQMLVNKLCRRPHACKILHTEISDTNESGNTDTPIYGLVLSFVIRLICPSLVLQECVEYSVECVQVRCDFRTIFTIIRTSLYKTGATLVRARDRGTRGCWRNWQQRCDLVSHHYRSAVSNLGWRCPSSSSSIYTSLFHRRSGRKRKNKNLNNNNNMYLYANKH